MGRALTGRQARISRSLDYLPERQHSQRRHPTCMNMGTGNHDTPDATIISNAWSCGTEWTVGDDLSSNHLFSITFIFRCEAPAASTSHRRDRWNTTNVNWNSFSATVEEAIDKFSPDHMSFRYIIYRINCTLLAAAKLHVGKSKSGLINQAPVTKETS